MIRNALFIVACEPDHMTASFQMRSLRSSQNPVVSKKTKLKASTQLPIPEEEGGCRDDFRKPCQNAYFEFFNAMYFTLKQLAAVRVNWAFRLFKKCIEISTLFERPDVSRSSQCTVTSACGTILG